MIICFFIFFNVASFLCLLNSFCIFMLIWSSSKSFHSFTQSISTTFSSLVLFSSLGAFSVARGASGKAIAFGLLPFANASFSFICLLVSFSFCCSLFITFGALPLNPTSFKVCCFAALLICFFGGSPSSIAKFPALGADSFPTARVARALRIVFFVALLWFYRQFFSSN